MMLLTLISYKVDSSELEKQICNIINDLGSFSLSCLMFTGLSHSPKWLEFQPSHSQSTKKKKEKKSWTHIFFVKGTLQSSQNSVTYVTEGRAFTHIDI